MSDNKYYKVTEMEKYPGFYIAGEQQECFDYVYQLVRILNPPEISCGYVLNHGTFASLHVAIEAYRKMLSDDEVIFNLLRINVIPLDQEYLAEGTQDIMHEMQSIQYCPDGINVDRVSWSEEFDGYEVHQTAPPGE